ncbi:MAG: hypothetical protein ACPGU7_06900 [Gammaproteobacteria bacterium]
MPDLKKRLSILYTATGLLLCALPWGGALAGLPGGTGVMETGEAAFAVQAAPGWVMDQEAGAQAGLPLVAYPQGQPFRTSSVMAYVRSVPRSIEMGSIDDLVQANVRMFQQAGRMSYEGSFERVITLDSGREAVVYHFRGAGYAPYEAIAFVEELEHFNIIVMGARNGIAFREALEDFESMVRSYRFLAGGLPGPGVADEPTAPVIEVDPGRMIN